MNTNQLMLKAIVLTHLMQAADAQYRDLTNLEREAIDDFNRHLEMLPEHALKDLDRDIDAVFPDLLAAIDCIVELPRIALA
jgi:hypothetical protein